MERSIENSLERRSQDAAQVRPQKQGSRRKQKDDEQVRIELRHVDLQVEIHFQIIISETLEK